MSEIYEEPPAAPPPPRPTLWKRLLRSALLPWLAIIGLVVLVVLGQSLRQEEPETPTQERKLDNALFELQMRYLIGGDEVLRQRDDAFYEQAKALDRGSIGQRLRFVVVAGELAGPHEAQARVRRLRFDIAKYKVKPTKSQQKAMAIAEELYSDYEVLKFKAPSVNAAERMTLRNALSWFGELALTPGGGSDFARLPWFTRFFTTAGGVTAPATLSRVPPPDRQARADVLEPAVRAFVTILAAAILAVLFGFLGGAALVIFIIVFLVGKLKEGIQTGVPHHHIYAETFALWMMLYAGLSLAAHFINADDASMWPAAVAMFLSLLALLWPVLRGIPWRQVREDIGWTWGRRPLLEPFIGFGCYLMTLPLAAVGLVITLVLILLQQQPPTEVVDNPFSPPSYPAHPVVETLAFGDLFARLQVVLLASVAAPIMEETMFRGVLYRHLREATRRWGGALSFLVSGTLVSFIFAVIHPQGWVAVPVLMALAYGFTIAREWRGTLIPAMVGHGLSNGLVTTLAMLLLS